MPDNEGMDLNLGVSFPGEQLAITILKEWGRARENMNEANRNKWDDLGFRLADVTVGEIVRLIEKARK